MKQHIPKLNSLLLSLRTLLSMTNISYVSGVSSLNILLMLIGEE